MPASSQMHTVERGDKAWKSGGRATQGARGKRTVLNAPGKRRSFRVAVVAGDDDAAILVESDVLDLPGGIFYWTATFIRGERIRFVDGRAASEAACRVAIRDVVASSAAADGD